MEKKIIYICFILLLIPMVVYAGGSKEDVAVKEQVKCEYKVIAYDTTEEKEFNVATYSMILTNFEDDTYEIEDENTPNSKLDKKYYANYLFDGNTFYELYTKAGNTCPTMFSYDAPSNMFRYGYFYTQKGHNNSDIFEQSEREIKGTKYVRKNDSEEWKKATSDKNEQKNDTFDCTYQFATDFGVLTDNQLILEVSLKRENIKSQKLINYILNATYYGTADTIKHPSVGSCKFGDDGEEDCEWTTLFELPITAAVANNQFYLQIDAETFDTLNKSMKNKKCIDKKNIYSYMMAETINSRKVLVVTTDKSKADASEQTVYDGDTSDIIMLSNLKDSIDTFNTKITSYPKDCSTGTEDAKTSCIKKQEEVYKDAKRITGLCKKTYADFSTDKAIVKACETFLEVSIADYAKEGYFGNRVITSETGSSCDDTLGSLGKWLKTIYDIMKYAVPVVIVVLGIKDFISGTISGNDDALKKAGSAFVKRLIWGAAFVALPVLITMILTFAFGGSFADICIF